MNDPGVKAFMASASSLVPKIKTDMDLMGVQRRDGDWMVLVWLEKEVVP